MWAEESVFYQIYPLGFTGVPFENNGGLAESEKQGGAPILKVADWIPHMERLGINAIYFSPIFESDTHGYNTRDYRMVDRRLGSNADFKELCEKLHAHGIKVVLDGVFNHVGRGFGPFQDVVRNRENSRYTGWFYRIAFDGDSPYHDGLWYEGWEGHYDLVKLNLRNEEVVNYLLDSVGHWMDEFGIDGLRLDVAYSLDEDFVRRLRSYCDSRKQDFFLLGEMLHGDYNRLVNDSMLHSATNYECYKGLYSSFNSMNLFEINHSLLRQFGPENWTLYKGKRQKSPAAALCPAVWYAGYSLYLLRQRMGLPWRERTGGSGTSPVFCSAGMERAYGFYCEAGAGKEKFPCSKLRLFPFHAVDKQTVYF